MLFLQDRLPKKNYADEIMRSTFIADALKNSQCNQYSNTCPIFLCRVTDAAKNKIQTIQEPGYSSCRR
jgi:hypothetical protein